MFFHLQHLLHADSRKIDKLIHNLWKINMDTSFFYNFWEKSEVKELIFMYLITFYIQAYNEILSINQLFILKHITIPYLMRIKFTFYLSKTISVKMK